MGDMLLLSSSPSSESIVVDSPAASAYRSGRYGAGARGGRLDFVGSGNLYGLFTPPNIEVWQAVRHIPNGRGC